MSAIPALMYPLDIRDLPESLAYDKDPKSLKDKLSILQELQERGAFDWHTTIKWQGYVKQTPQTGHIGYESVIDMVAQLCIKTRSYKFLDICKLNNFEIRPSSKCYYFNSYTGEKTYVTFYSAFCTVAAKDKEDCINFATHLKKQWNITFIPKVYTTDNDYKNAISKVEYNPADIVDTPQHCEAVHPIESPALGANNNDANSNT